MRLTLHTFLSIDGVMQAPGAPDEDADGGFGYGGWLFPYGDANFEEATAAWFSQAGAFLLGRRTYDIFRGYWPKVTDPSHPIAGKLNALPKYVASSTLTSVSGWQNTVLLGGDLVAGVAQFRQQAGGELQVHGSGELAQTLIDHGLVDEYRLLYFPVHLGRGKRLFRDATKAGALRLTSSNTTSTGVIIATYEPAGPVRHGSYPDPEQ